MHVHHSLGWIVYARMDGWNGMVCPSHSVVVVAVAVAATANERG